LHQLAFEQIALHRAEAAAACSYTDAVASNDKCGTAAANMSSASTKRRGRGGRVGGSTGDSPADRALRQKADKIYHDGMESDSDEETHKQTFSVQDKLQSSKFPMYFVKELRGDEVCLEYFQR
jgi:hypothetical protein